MQVQHPTVLTGESALEIRIHRGTEAYPTGSTLGSDGAWQLPRDIDPEVAAGPMALQLKHSGTSARRSRCSVWGQGERVGTASIGMALRCASDDRRRALCFRVNCVGQSEHASPAPAPPPLPPPPKVATTLPPLKSVAEEAHADVGPITGLPEHASGLQRPLPPRSQIVRERLNRDPEPRGSRAHRP